MRKFKSYLVAFVLANTLSIAVFAQNVTISGSVKNSLNQESASAISVSIKGTDSGTYTDDKGNFTISVKSLPVTLIFTSVGYEPKEVVVKSASEKLQVALVATNALGQEVVVSASRVPEKIMESPVTIERLNALALRNSPAVNFYDAVSALKGVDVTTSSLTFRTPTTRGFGGSGNTRFNQLVDGMDNQAPGLNFSVGAIIGLNELDVDNMELLNGASSALYGPGGENGTLLMTSKNPFVYQGLSFNIKTGIMHTDGSEWPTAPYYNWSVRWAKKVSEKFAFKITSEIIQAKDWLATDYRDYDIPKGVVVAGNRQTDPNYNGINVYGDETTADLRQVLNGIAGQAPFLAPFISTLTTNPINVSRTGYTEQEIINPNTVNFKIGGSLNYKITPKTELIFAGYWGTGNTVYTAASRYSLLDFKMGQYKLQLLNKDWMIQAYTTQENAGGAYSLGATSQNFNELWKPSGGSTGWYAQYGQAFLDGKLKGLTDYNAHNAARSVADIGRPAAGSPEFIAGYDYIKGIPSPAGGALLDRSDLYSIEGNYNLTKFTQKVADVLVGVNFRRYSLNSQGTLFADSTGPIGIKEYGAYIQAARSITNNFKLSASARYDKNENFEGRVTPRITALYKVKENNNIRLSFQTAYRFPSNQQQWINLVLPGYNLIGGNKNFIDFYHFDTNPVYLQEDMLNGQMVQWNYPLQKAESLSSFELGYKGLLMQSKLFIDMYGYYGSYKNFTARTFVVQSKNGQPLTPSQALTGQVYSVPINADGNFTTWGYGLGMNYLLGKGFNVGMNLASDNLEEAPEGVITSFNSPDMKINASFGNSGFGRGKRIGFNVAYKWQAEFYFQGDLANGTLPAVQTLDAQVSYKLPASKSIVKLGATNLLNQYYYNGVGNAYVGGLYYLSFGYNIY